MSMRFLRALAFTIVLLSPSLAFAQAPPAQEACRCWCAGSGQQPAQSSDVGNPDECSQVCATLGTRYVMCATGTQSPADNLLCFTPRECEAQKGRFTGQAQDCIEGMGYCTPVQRSPIELSFKLGNVSKVSDLGDYIQKGYNLLLGIAVTIAIVMVMVGGLQYVIGAGAPEQVSKAKHRIQNAVIGLALLLCAYVILYTVNPQLVKLEVPAVPMAKRIEVIDESVSCEKLMEPVNGIASKATFGAVSKNKDGRDDLCGATKIVLTDAEGNEVPDGSKCQVAKCPASAGAGARCAGYGDKASCAICQNVVPDMDDNNSNLLPSPNVCASLEAPDKPDETYNYCFYTHDPSVIVSGIDVAVEASIIAAASLVTAGSTTAVISGIIAADHAEDIVQGSCAQMQINCSSFSTCGGYDPFTVGYEDMQVKTDMITGTKDLDDIEPGFLGGTLDFKMVCEANPCHKDLDKGGCVFDDSAKDTTCVSKKAFDDKQAREQREQERQGREFGPKT